MNQLISYMLQGVAVSGILYGYYYFALRNSRFHQYNRYFLLAIPLFSFLIPLLNIPVYFTKEQIDASPLLQTLHLSNANEADEGLVITATKAAKTNWLRKETALKLFYLSVCGLFFARLVIALIKIFSLTQKYPAEKINNVQFLNTHEPGTPFSFFNWLFWNKETELSSAKGTQMFRHELYHIQQKHSADIIYTELVSALFWINPFFHLIKKELRAIHEFLADRFAVTENTRWQYAELLLMQALNTKQRLVHPFFHNQIKRRIAMITQSSKPGYQYFRKLLILPLMAIMIALFAFSYRSINDTGQTNTGIDQLEYNGSGINNFTDTSKPQKTDETRVFSKVQVEAAFPGGDQRWAQFIERNINPRPEKSDKAPHGVYTVVIQFIVGVDGKISDITALTKHGYGLEAEVIRVITKSPVWSPAIADGRKVRSYKKQPVTFQIGKGDKVTSDSFNSDKLLNEVVTVGLFDETRASFPGGTEKWSEFLTKTINPTVPVDSGAVAGTYKTIVQFIVQPDGSLSDFKPVTKHGYGMEKEVIRLLKAGPKWEPATSKGNKVASYIQQPVTFAIEDEPIENGSENDLPKTTPTISVSVLKKATLHQLLNLPESTEIISFTFTTDHENGDISEAPCKGSAWCPSFRRLIGGLTPGRLITFDSIKILQNGKEIKIPGRAYYTTH